MLYFTIIVTHYIHYLSILTPLFNFSPTGGKICFHLWGRLGRGLIHEKLKKTVLQTLKKLLHEFSKIQSYRDWGR
jgi:hypothetical protein